MRTGLLTIFFSLLIVSCKSKHAIPAGILSQKKMQAVLWDMMRADQFLANYVLNRDTSLNKKTESIKRYQQILEINQVSKEKFQHSFLFYKSHPALLKVIMDSIANIPVAPPEEIYKHKKRKDSLIITADSLAGRDTAKKFKKITKLPTN